MLARCTRCRSTFFTDEYGLQTCPHCKAQVLIADPHAPPGSPNAAPTSRKQNGDGAKDESGEAREEGSSDESLSAGGEGLTQDGSGGGSGGTGEDEAGLEETSDISAGETPASDPTIPPWYRTGDSGEESKEEERIPWERQEELGLVRAFTETVKGMLGDPESLFRRMRWTEAPSAHTYFLLVAVMPAVIGSIINLQLQDQEASVQAMEDAIQGLPEANQEMARQFAEFFATSGSPGLVGTIVGLPLVYFAALYLGAGIAHLFLMLLGEVRSGWTGTFKAFVYGCTPMIFAIVPVCGSTVAQLWSVGLCVYGVMKAQRTNLGYSILGVVGIPVLLCCCFGGLGTALLVAQMTGAGLQ